MTKEQILQLIEQKYIKKMGKYFGYCVFHTEHTASCVYDHQKDAFYCFGCGENGDGKKLAEKIETCTTTT